MGDYLEYVVKAFLPHPEYFSDVKAIVDAPINCTPEVLVAMAEDCQSSNIMNCLGKPGDDLSIAELDVSENILGIDNYLCKFFENSEPQHILESIKNITRANSVSNKLFRRSSSLIGLEFHSSAFTTIEYNIGDKCETAGRIIDYTNLDFIKKALDKKELTICRTHINELLGLIKPIVEEFDKRKTSEDKDKFDTSQKTRTNLEQKNEIIKIDDELADLILKNYHARLGRLGINLIKTWPHFVRCVNDLFEHEYQTLIPLPKPFVVPGGRFIEIYYWDTYWIILGLLVSNLYNVAKDSISNFFYMIERYGFIPNGSRTYYLDRSQPPLLSSMLRAYHYATNDMIFIKENLDLLRREYEFWMKPFGGHCVKVKLKDGTDACLNRYYSIVTKPRLESYRMDVMVALEFKRKYKKTDADLLDLYRNIRAGAESGWDFSSRWLRPAIEKGDESAIHRSKDDDGTMHNVCLVDIDTTNVIPCDLNAFLYLTELDLAYFYGLLDHDEDKKVFLLAAEKRKNAMLEYNWNSEQNRWVDYDMKKKKFSKVLSAASFVPLWAGLSDGYEDPNKRIELAKSLSPLVRQYGIISTTLRPGLQWDSPNIWACNHHIAVDFLAGGRFWNYDDRFKNEISDAHTLSANWASRFINTVLYRYEKCNTCCEKYDCNKLGKSGLDGEYITQEGFGWTNGSALDFLYKFGKELTPQGLVVDIPIQMDESLKINEVVLN